MGLSKMQVYDWPAPKYDLKYCPSCGASIQSEKINENIREEFLNDNNWIYKDQGSWDKYLCSFMGYELNIQHYCDGYYIFISYTNKLGERASFEKEYKA